ncbi:ABC transporter permease [Nocardiopsis ansamitocini]|uniref:Transport permease protein n=1 Tax=Nocardiopsis ansamitocini TaxID=1670832 RepID=A0A9W6UIP9_9ACTN|nr:ABC transporter permease [Nocardiopsis ansamitocini]GLU47270.1 transport permease protein [Nocardiopsis ansamitocini]
MNTTLFAVRLGLARGWIEFRHTLTSPTDLASYCLNSVVFLVVLLFLDGNAMEATDLAGTDVSQATIAMPGFLAMTLVLGGVLSMAQLLASEREDGTLLRAKATPKGILGYLVGKVLTIALMSGMSMLVILVPAAFLVSGLQFSATGWLVLLGITVLGFLAVLPLGAIAGALFPNPRVVVGTLMLVIMGLVVISGALFPISMLPDWLAGVAQVFPVYWIALGMRSAMLPDLALVEEIGESWRHLETLGALGAWAALGLVIAPLVLRRMARKESGGSVAERRHKAMQRLT